jgi:hypothetical protein
MKLHLYRALKEIKNSYLNLGAKYGEEWPLRRLTQNTADIISYENVVWIYQLDQSDPREWQNFVNNGIRHSVSQKGNL